MDIPTRTFPYTFVVGLDITYYEVPEPLMLPEEKKFHLAFQSIELQCPNPIHIGDMVDTYICPARQGWSDGANVRLKVTDVIHNISDRKSFVVCDDIEYMVSHMQPFQCQKDADREICSILKSFGWKLLQ